MDPALDYSCRGNPAFWISAGFDWVCIGSVFGDFLENDGRRMDLADDGGMARRGGVWRAAEPTERVVQVAGRASTMGYLCGSVTLLLSSGRQVRARDLGSGT